MTLARAAGAVYDLVEHKTVAFSSDGRTTRIPVSLPAADGKVFLVTANPLDQLTAAVSGGTLVVTSPDREVLIPIGVFAEGAKPYYGVVRGGRFTCPLAAGRVTVRNLADGRSVSDSAFVP